MSHVHIILQNLNSNRSLRGEPTSSKANFDEGHPVGLVLRVLSSELQNLPLRQVYLEVAVATCTNRYYVFHGDTVLEGSLSRVED